MKTSRICAAVAAMLATFAGESARAEPGTATGGDVVVLQTYLKLAMDGNTGPNRIGKNTGAGIMDTNVYLDQTAAAKANAAETLLGLIYTRSAATPNNENSYMQGGFMLAKIKESGVELGQPINLPTLNGERAFMRPLIAFTPKFAVLIAAAEDNGLNNNNPMPVMFLADKATGQLVPIANSTRGQGNINKPTNLVRQALNDGIQVNNPNNQRGPHMIVPVSDNSFLVGMQYNNQAQEVFRVTVNDDATVRMNWLRRYSNNAVHNRPQVAFDGAAGYMTAIECNAQPANIGIRLTKFDVNTGNPIQSKIVERAIPQQNKYVAEPHIGLVGGKVAIQFANSSKARVQNGNNGHAGGGNVTRLGLYDPNTLDRVGNLVDSPANYQRHAGMFTTSYGPNGEKAVAVISGSSTGIGKGLLQIIPVKADGSLGEKDFAKMYTVSTFSDVANLQARGKRNPNNQAKGFINGIGDVPNPGFDKPNGFMPEVKTFSASAVTGFADAAAAQRGLKEGMWLSLIPASWKAGLKTTPGQPTDKPSGQGTETGPLPRTTGPSTDPSGDAKQADPPPVTNGEDLPAPSNGGGSQGFGDDAAAGCNVSHKNGGAGLSAFALVALGALLATRRKKEAQ